MAWSKILLIVAFILFVLAALGVQIPNSRVNLLAAGLALLTAALFLV